MDMAQGVLILHEIPDEECKKRIADFLSKYAKNSSHGKIKALLRKTPVILARNIPPQVGMKLADSLGRLGASASFLSEDSVKIKEKELLSIEKPEVSAQSAEMSGLERAGSDSRALAEERYEKRLIEASALAGDGHQKAPYPESSQSEESGDVGFTYNSKKKKEFSCCLADRIAEVNKELWIIFSMVAIAGLANYLVASQYMILGFYSFPTILSAYFYGRRHAVMTAVLTIILVGILLQFNSAIFGGGPKMTMATGKWYHMMAWGSVLICTAYAMGTLYERHMRKVRELRKTYQGLIVILRHFISKDQYTENHCYRVSLYGAKIASYLGLDDEEIEDIRSAGLLHDIGKLKISRELLYKAAKLSEDEYKEIKNHVNNSAEILEPLKGPLGRIIPIILAHHDRFDGKGYRPNRGEEIPIGARVLAVADVYDALTSDRPYRKAMAPTEAKEIIVKGSGKDFDPQVVKAFLAAFERGEMDVPNLIV